MQPEGIDLRVENAMVHVGSEIAATGAEWTIEGNVWWIRGPPSTLSVTNVFHTGGSKYSAGVVYGSMGSHNTCVMNVAVKRSRKADEVRIGGITIAMRNGELFLDGPVPATAVVNGRRVDLGGASSAAPAPSRRVHRVDDRVIDKITIHGSGRVDLSHAARCAESLRVVITGSGNVVFDDNVFETLTIDVQGSGSVTGKATAKTAFLSITGSITGTGSIHDVHASEYVEALVFGPGIIMTTAGKDARVYESKTGSGSIRIHRRD